MRFPHAISKSSLANMNVYMKRSGVGVCLFAMALATSSCESGGRGYSSYGGGYSSALSGSSGNMTADEKPCTSNPPPSSRTIPSGCCHRRHPRLRPGRRARRPSGRQGQAAAIGCGAGAAAGGIAGGVDGYLKGKAAQTQANEVLMTRSVTADVQKQNAQLQAAVQTAQRVVDDDKKKLDQINAALAAKTMTLENARARRRISARTRRKSPRSSMPPARTGTISSMPATSSKPAAIRRRSTQRSTS